MLRFSSIYSCGLIPSCCGWQGSVMASRQFYSSCLNKAINRYVPSYLNLYQGFELSFLPYNCHESKLLTTSEVPNIIRVTQTSTKLQTCTHMLRLNARHVWPNHPGASSSPYVLIMNFICLLFFSCDCTIIMVIALRAGPTFCLSSWKCIHIAALSFGGQPDTHKNE